MRAPQAKKKRATQSPRKPGTGHRNSERMQHRWMGEQIRGGNGFPPLKGQPQYIAVQGFGQRVMGSAEPVEKGIRLRI